MSIPWQRVPQQKTWVDSLTSAFNSSAQMFGTMKALSEQRAIQERYDTLGKALQDAGGDFNGVDPSLYSDAHGMQALGKLTNDWLKSSEGMRKVTENNRQSLIDRTNYLFAQMQTAEANQNNPEVFSGALTNAINGMGLPYKLSQREDGNFALSYMGPEGDRPLEKVYSPQDAYATIKSLALNRPQTARLLAQTDIALQLRNTEYQQDPNRWLAMYDDKTGNMMTVIPQFQRIQNEQGGMSIQPMYAVMQRGKPLQTISQQDFMQQYGMQPQAFRDAYRMRQDAQNLALRQQAQNQRAAIAGATAAARNYGKDPASMEIKANDKRIAGYCSYINDMGDKTHDEALRSRINSCIKLGGTTDDVLQRIEMNVSGLREKFPEMSEIELKRYAAGLVEKDLRHQQQRKNKGQSGDDALGVGLYGRPRQRTGQKTSTSAKQQPTEAAVNLSHATFGKSKEEQERLNQEVEEDLRQAKASLGGR